MSSTSGKTAENSGLPAETWANDKEGFLVQRGKRAFRGKVLFCEDSGRICRMDKPTHAAKLRAAMATRGFERAVIVDALNVNPRTVTNWTTGKTMPSDRERAVLRTLMPGYDNPGDPVELAILGSDDLTEDRRYALLSHYKRLLREQSETGSHEVG